MIGLVEGDPSVEVRPEVRVLLYAARTCPGSDAEEQIRALLSQGVDWASLIRTAYLHGVVPLLRQTLKMVCPGDVPEPVLEQLWLAHGMVGITNELLTKELVQVQDLFDVHQISAIPIKGPILAHTVYGGLSLRSAGDLDILVREEEIEKVKDLLITHGYQLVKPRKLVGNLKEHLSLLHELMFRNPETGVFVETLWSFSNDRFHSRINPEALWRHRDVVSLAGRLLPSLRREELLLILCEHGTKHVWNRLKWICDIAELVRTSEGLDWEQAFERARAAGSERALLLGLFLAHGLLDCKLPDTVCKRMQADRKVEVLARQVYERLFSSEVDSFGVFSWKKCLFHFHSRESTADQMRHVALFVRFFVTPRRSDMARLPLPRFLCFVYYLLLPVRLIRNVVEHLRIKSRWYNSHAAESAY